MKELIRNILKEETEEIDQKVMNFLLRRIKKEERKLGKNVGDFKPLIVTEYSFEGLPGYGFSSWLTKKEMEKSLINMLYENDMIDYWIHDLDERDPQRIKLIKTVRKFLNYILE